MDNQRLPNNHPPCEYISCYEEKLAGHYWIICSGVIYLSYLFGKQLQLISL
jgi:hypothetical protein